MVGGGGMRLQEVGVCVYVCVWQPRAAGEAAV